MHELFQEMNKQPSNSVEKFDLSITFHTEHFVVEEKAKSFL